MEATSFELGFIEYLDIEVVEENKQRDKYNKQED